MHVCCNFDLRVLQELSFCGDSSATCGQKCQHCLVSLITWGIWPNLSWWQASTTTIQEWPVFPLMLLSVNVGHVTSVLTLWGPSNGPISCFCNHRLLLGPRRVKLRLFHERLKAPLSTFLNSCESHAMACTLCYGRFQFDKLSSALHEAEHPAREECSALHWIPTSF